MKLLSIAKAAAVGAVVAQIPRLAKAAKAEGKKMLRKGLDRLAEKAEERRGG